MNKSTKNGLVLSVILLLTVSVVAPVSAFSISGSSSGSGTALTTGSGTLVTKSASSTGWQAPAKQSTVSQKFWPFASKLVVRSVTSGTWQKANPFGTIGSTTGRTGSGSTGAGSTGWVAPKTGGSTGSGSTGTGTWQKANPFGTIGSATGRTGSGSTGAGSTGWVAPKTGGSTGSGSTGSSVKNPNDSWQKANPYVAFTVSGSGSSGSGSTGSTGSTGSGSSGWTPPTTPGNQSSDSRISGSGSTGSTGGSSTGSTKYPNDSWQKTNPNGSFSTGSSGGSTGSTQYPNDSWQKTNPYGSTEMNPPNTVPPTHNDDGREASMCDGRYYPRDIDGHWSEIYVRRLYDLCVIEGYQDGSFRPNQNITRAELVKMALYARGIKPDLGCYDADCGSPFNDLDMWQGAWIRPAYDRGIVKGYSYNMFRPNRAITRAEAVKVVLATFGYEPVSVDKSWFNDVNGWSTGWIEKAHQMGVVQGIGNGDFDPNRPVTRAEAAKIIVKTIEYWDTHIN